MTNSFIIPETVKYSGKLKKYIYDNRYREKFFAAQIVYFYIFSYVFVLTFVV